MEVPPLAEVRRRTEKKRDAWWTVLLVDPMATPLVRWTAKWTRVAPNQVSWAALLLGLGAAGCFAQAEWEWLVAGTIVYHISFVLDCMDGKLARLTGRGSEFGAWLDYVFDRVRVLICAVALMGGQFQRTGDVAYIWLALAVVFLDMLRYIDALQIFKVRQGMRKKLQTRADAAPFSEVTAAVSEVSSSLSDLVAPPSDDQSGITPTETETATPKVSLLVTQQSFLGRFRSYTRFRDLLVRHRIRTHLVSGIEFQMGVFIVAPLIGSIMWPTVVAGALLLAFELAIIYKLLLSTRDFERIMAQYDREEQPTTLEEQPVELDKAAVAPAL